jgi:AcrR family transcriptional regulator
MIAPGPARQDPADAPRHLQAATRGRPRLRHDAEILDAALRAFAASGYDSMSVRALNAELGLSHGAINQRFGSKMQLFCAAIDHGFATFFADMATERAIRPPALGDLEELRETIRAFLLASARRPELGRLMNQEGLHATERLEYIVAKVLVPGMSRVVGLLRTLSADGEIHPVSARALFVLVAHGAEAPYTLAGLSDAFDEVDGVLDQRAHGETVTDLLMRGLRRHDGGPASASGAPDRDRRAKRGAGGG